MPMPALLRAGLVDLAQLCDRQLADLVVAHLRRVQLPMIGVADDVIARLRKRVTLLLVALPLEDTPLVIVTGPLSPLLPDEDLVLRPHLWIDRRQAESGRRVTL